jgi:hypothetical protein
MERKYRKAEMTPEAVEVQLRALMVKYHNSRKSYSKEPEDIATQIILSETFI